MDNLLESGFVKKAMAGMNVYKKLMAAYNAAKSEKSDGGAEVTSQEKFNLFMLASQTLGEEFGLAQAYSQKTPEVSGTYWMHLENPPDAWGDIESPLMVSVSFENGEMLVYAPGKAVPLDPDYIEPALWQGPVFVPQPPSGVAD